MKIQVDPYRKALAGVYMNTCMGKEGDDAVKELVNGSEEDISLDYYLGAERMVNAT